MEQRNLLFLKSKDLQTEQEQPITGTPCDVPVPKKVTFKILKWFVLILEGNHDLFYPKNPED